MPSVWLETENEDQTKPNRLYIVDWTLNNLLVAAICSVFLISNNNNNTSVRQSFENEK